MDLEQIHKCVFDHRMNSNEADFAIIITQPIAKVITNNKPLPDNPKFAGHDLIVASDYSDLLEKLAHCRDAGRLVLFLN